MAMHTLLTYKGMEVPVPSGRERMRRRTETIMDASNHRRLCIENQPQLADLTTERIRELLKRPDLWEIPAIVRCYARIT